MIGIVVHQAELHRVVDLLPRNGLLGVGPARDGFVECEQGDDIHRIEIDVTIDKHQMRKFATHKLIRKIVAGAGDEGFVEEEKVLDLDAVLHADGIEVQQGFCVGTVTHAPIHGRRDK